MATQMTSLPATEDQIKHAVRLIEDASGKALKQLALDEDAMQRLVQLGVAGIMPHILTILQGLTVTDEFADEETKPKYGYPSSYKSARPAIEQMAALKAAFPTLKSYDSVLAARDVLAGTEGNFLIPDWRILAPTYVEAVELMLAALKKSCNGRFKNYRENQLGANQLRESGKKAAAFQKLREEQAGHDVLVVFAQLGARHGGRSVKRARVVMGGNEFGLGVFEIGCMLLTHPERLKHYTDLWIDCAGDEYALSAGGDPCSVPHFRSGGGRIILGSRVVGRPHDCGSASALVAPLE